MKSPFELSKDAKKAFNEEDYRLATRRYRQAEDGGAYASRFELGIALARRGRVREADVVKNRTGLEPQGVRAIEVAICKALLDRENWEEADVRLVNLATKYSADAEILEMQGCLAFATGEFVKASNLFESARSLGNKGLIVSTGLARAYARMGKKDTAIGWYLEVIKVAPVYDASIYFGELFNLIKGDKSTINTVSKHIRHIDNPQLWISWALAIVDTSRAIALRLCKGVLDHLNSSTPDITNIYWYEFCNLIDKLNLFDRAVEILLNLQISEGISYLTMQNQPSEKIQQLLLDVAKASWFSPVSSHLVWQVTSEENAEDLARGIVGGIVVSSNLEKSEEWALYLARNNQGAYAFDLLTDVHPLKNHGVKRLIMRAQAFHLLGLYDSARKAVILAIQGITTNDDLVIREECYITLSKILTATPAEYACLDELSDIVLDRGDPDEVITLVKVMAQFYRRESGLNVLSGLIESEFSIEEITDLLRSLLIENVDGKGRLIEGAFIPWKSALDHRGTNNWRIATALAIGTEEPDRAKLIIDRVTTNLDDDNSLWLQCAYAYKGTGELERTIESFRKAHFNPLNANDYVVWYQSVLELDSQNGACAELNKALTGWNLRDNLAIDWVTVREAYVISQVQVNDIARFAKEDLDSAGDIWSITNELWTNRQWKECEDLLNQSIELDPRNALHRYQLNSVLLQLLRPKEAKEASDAAEKLGPPSVFGATRSANALIAFDDVDGAIKCLREALKLPNISPLDNVNLLEDLSQAELIAGDVNSAHLHAHLAVEIAIKQINSHPESDFNGSLTIWPRFQLGYVESYMGSYEEAIDQYQLLKWSDHPYPAHNIADILDSQARYSESRSTWEDAIRIYQPTLIKGLKERNYTCYFYAANALRAVGRSHLAVQICHIGLLFVPEDPFGLSCLLEACLQQARTAKEPEEASYARRMASNAYNQLRCLLPKSNSQHMYYSNLLIIGSVALSMEEVDTAIEVLKLAIVARSNERAARQALMKAYLKKNLYKEAITQGSILLACAPYNLEVMITLGRANLLKDNLDEAERFFTKVLEYSPRHYDAKIGMGELFLAMAEKRLKDTEKHLLIDYYQRASDAFQDALDTARSDDRAKDYSKEELAQVNYLLGYSIVGQYEAQVAMKGLGFLKAAQKAFNDARHLDKNHHKAERAFLRIRKKTQPLSAEVLTQKWAPLFVSVVSILVFCIAGYNFIWGREALQPAHYEFTNTAWEQIKSAIIELPKEKQVTLKLLKGKIFASSDDLLQAAMRITGGTWAEKHAALLTEASFVPASPEARKYLDMGYFILTAFGALIFFIAGIYLPQLTKLKIGAIQLDKSTVQQTVTGSLGIPR